PVARFQERTGRIVGWQKGHGKVTIRYACERFSAHPDVAPLFRGLELLVSKRSELAIFAVERGDRLHGNGIGDREVAKAAAPGQSAVQTRPVISYGGLDVENVRMVEV